MVSIFIIFIGEDWDEIAVLYLRASRSQGAASYTIARLYFVMLLLIGHIMLLALFTALMLRNFGASLKEKEKMLERDHKKRTIRRFSKMAITRANSKLMQSLAESTNSENISNIERKKVMKNHPIWGIP